MGKTVVVLPSAARTVSGNTGQIDAVEDARALRVQVEVTAFAGTSPTLDVVLEDSVDGVNWNPLATFARATGATREVLNVTGLFARQVRCRYEVGGTSPSFTFAVIAYAE